MRSLTVKCLFFLTFVTGMLFSASAFADDCNSLHNNRTWNHHFDKMRSDIQTQNYDGAFESAKILFDICPRSPALNYYIGTALKETGEGTKATIYFQKASEYTSEFEVKTEMARLIWYARYEGENPDRTAKAIEVRKQENARLNEQVDRLTIENAAKEAEITALKDSMESLKQTSNIIVLSNLEDVKRKYGILMWSGVGMSVIGIAATAAGTYFYLSSDKYEDKTGDIGSFKTERTYEIKKDYIAGISLMGAGIGLTVAGLVMTGIGGYHYTHIDTNMTFSFNVAPNSAVFNMTF